MKFFLFLILAISLVAFGAWYEIGQQYGNTEPITIHVTAKGRDWLAGRKDTQSWTVTDKGGKRYEVRKHPFDFGKPEEYKRLHVGSTYRCELRGRSYSWAIFRSHKRISDCKKV